MLRILLFYHKKKNIYGVLSILWLHCTLHISAHMYDIFYSHNNMYNTHHNPRLPRNVLAFLFLLHHNPYIHTERYDNLHHIDLLKSLRKARYASLFLFFLHCSNNSNILPGDRYHQVLCNLQNKTSYGNNPQH